MKVLRAPKIIFRCEVCGAVCEGEFDEFQEQNTIPPSFLTECAFCHCIVRCYPSPLIARAAGVDTMARRDAVYTSIVEKIMDS
jgi:hypothetical protein